MVIKLFENKVLNYLINNKNLLSDLAMSRVLC